MPSFGLTEFHPAADTGQVLYTSTFVGNDLYLASLFRAEALPVLDVKVFESEVLRKPWTS